MTQQPVKYRLFMDSYETRIALYDRISNLSTVLQLIQNKHNCCVINAKTVLHVNQVLCAVNKALNYQLNDKMITKQLNKEILFGLSLSKNIDKSLDTFGVKPTDDSLPVLVVSVDPIDGTTGDDIFSQIDGKVLPIESLKSLRDDSLIDKIYKVDNWTDECHKLDLIVSRIATKDII